MQPVPAPPEPPHLRLLPPSSASSARSLERTWLCLFASLCACGGHGIFLFTALTRLAKLPGARELGGPLQIAVLAWFIASAPLAIASLVLRGRFLRLAPALARATAATALVLALAAFAVYLRAVALA